jgi:Phage tail tube protein
MVCETKKIDSNVTGLRFAEEECLQELPVSPVWYPLEPNSYADFGGTLTTVSRNPINPSRQRKKGTVVDLEASGGFNQDLTQNNMTRILQGFMFNRIKERPTTEPMNGAPIAITSISTTDDSYNAASGLAAFVAGSLVFAEGFDNAANNGIKDVVTAAAGKITVSQNLVNDASPDGRLSVVGYQFAADTIELQAPVGAYARIADAGGAVDFTTLGLNPGEWVFVGGDNVANRFPVYGFARIGEINAEYIAFDKTDFTAVADDGDGVTLQLFFSDVLRNKTTDEAIEAVGENFSYQLERTLGSDGVGVQSEYLTGAQANELTVNITQADKVTVDLSFIACDNEQRSGTEGLKAGTRPTLETKDMYNTSSDFSRIKLASVDETASNVTPMFAFLTDMTLTINNNVSPLKSIGILGAFATNAGTFEVGGSLTAYFADMAAVKAVRNNADITLDIAMVKNNTGLVFDMPLLTLGNGRITVEQDSPIMLPLDMNVAENKFGYSVMIGVFNYLPTIANQ